MILGTMQSSCTSSHHLETIIDRLKLTMIVSLYTNTHRYVMLNVAAVPPSCILYIECFEGPIKMGKCSFGLPS